MSTLAERWHESMRRARAHNPDRIAAHIVMTADTGLRAARYDTDGSRTTFVACEDPDRCDDGPDEHTHMVTADPTGNAAVRGRHTDQNWADLDRLNLARRDFVTSASVVLAWVSGNHSTNWAGVVRLAAELMPGTVQAGIDVDHDHHLPHHIAKVETATLTVRSIARDHLPRDPSTDERNWTAGLADEECCAWHLAVHRRYRRPRVSGTNICQGCIALATLLGRRPPQWLLEAEVDRDAKPKAWTHALSRCMDELGVVRDRSA